MASHHVRPTIDELFEYDQRPPSPTQYTTDMAFNRQLRSDSQRLVKIYIGDSEQPLQFQQTVLENISEYFERAFREGRWTEGQNGVLRFKEDSLDVWKILASWIIRRTPLKASLEGDLLLSISRWTTGDKYDIKEFQNAVMTQMLTDLSPEGVPATVTRKVSAQMVRTAFECTPPGSVLRTLLVERRAFEVQVFVQRGDREPLLLELGEAESLDGTGFVPLVWKTCMTGYVDPRLPRFTGKLPLTVAVTSGRLHWGRYMLAAKKAD